MKKRNLIPAVAGFALFASFGGTALAEKSIGPNVIVILTDDQGYGDFSCHGNPYVKTPHIDNLYSQSTRLTDFHVSPCCAPTRASLMTGHYTNRTGCWHTVGGRSLLLEKEVTVPQVLKKNGYATGMFGKWHLGDNYPFRPQDRGFDYAFWHKGGGVGQLPDYWNNDYFDDTYYSNDKPERCDGYCTDVWFSLAIKFMDRKVNAGKPFFTYLSTNAPHGPYYVANSYSAPFLNVKGVVNPYYYGMVVNLDENMGRLLRFLDEKGIADNTIVLFMTDNGAANGSGFTLERGTGFVTKGYNAGMRGGKISEYEGGHRVPCFVRWPNGGVKAGVDIADLTSHIDIFPTVLDMLKIKTPKGVKFDGQSLKGRITGSTQKEIVRTVVVDNQRLELPVKYKNYSVMNQKWRLVNGKELYNIAVDPEQRHNVAGENPDLVKQLAGDYENWWNDIAPVFAETPAISVCPKQEPVTLINAMDMHPDVDETPVMWEQEHVRKYLKNTGWYQMFVPKAGNYRLKVFRYAPEANLSIDAVAPKTLAEPGTNVAVLPVGDKLDLRFVRFNNGTKSFEAKVDPSLAFVGLNVPLTKGTQRWRVEFVDGAGEVFAAPYFEVEKDR